MEKTILQFISDYQTEILRGNLVPSRAAEILTELSALLGNLNAEIVFRDMEYNKILLIHLEAEKSANKAKIKANITKEYEDMRVARNAKDLAIEMIRSLKYFIKSQEEEYKQSGN